ncbi:MAG TPA: histidine phosphatase family protein [Steroidobacteraceae bacterium]|nr:histidine phosphatase family protein [Steroidobacteraceae bacterium]
MLLTLIRHGEVNGRTQVLRGRSDDALTEHGLQQMHDIFSTIQSEVIAIASSPLQRCRAFAANLSKQRELPLHILDELREINFGEWDNLTLSEAEAHDPRSFHAFKHDTERWQPPGGEPYTAFRDRVRTALQQIINLNVSHVLAVTHGGVIRAMLAECLQLSAASAARIGVPPAGLCQLWLDENGSGSLLRLQWLEKPC